MNSAPTLITPAIICGGSGTRLWPLSRETRPKQFFALTGGFSTFQQTVQCVSDPAIFGEDDILRFDDIYHRG